MPELDPTPVRRSSYISDALHYETYERAVVLPMYRNLEYGVSYSGVIHNGRILPESLLWRSQKYRILPTLVESIGEPTSELDEAIYAGPWSNSYGHFLLESTARLWATTLAPDVPIIWSCEANDDSQSCNRWQSQILTALGVRNPIVFLSQPIVVKRLMLPRAGLEIPGIYLPEHRRFLQKIPSNSEGNGRRAWISRAASPGRVAISGEEEVAEKAKALGWDVIIPEKLSVEDQIDLLTSYDSIMGWKGSAFHTLILAKNVKTELYIVPRGPELEPVFQTIADVSPFKQTICRVPLVNKNSTARTVIMEPENIKDLFDIMDLIDHQNIF